MAPDGSYVGGDPQMAPDGTYVGGEPDMAPDGTYVGKEELSIGVMPEAGSWKDYSAHPEVKLEIQGDLSKKQREQVRMVAKLLESIVSG